MNEPKDMQPAPAAEEGPAVQHIFIRRRPPAWLAVALRLLSHGVALAYPLAVLAGGVWLFARFGPSGWLWLVLMLVIVLTMAAPKPPRNPEGER